MLCLMLDLKARIAGGDQDKLVWRDKTCTALTSKGAVSELIYYE